MASFGKSQKLKGIQEERGFTNPHVRFIRKRGRIIPIINKKRIGQDITGIGESLFIKGSSIGIASVAIKRTNAAKSLSKLMSNFKFKGKIKVNPTDSFKVKGLKRSAKITGKTLKFAGKNSGKIGAIAALIGIGLKVGGDEMQMRSSFGKDFFFTKDRQGRNT